MSEFKKRSEWLCIWWKMKITETRYGYSKATAGLSIVILVSAPVGLVITALPEVKLSFSTRGWQFCDFSE